MIKSYYTSFFQKWNKIYIRQINPDGTRTNFNVEYKPKLYVKSESPNCEFKTLHGDELFEIEFSTIESAKEYAKASQNEIFGYPRFPYACVDDQYPYEIEYNFDDLRIAFVDIETESDTHYSTIKNPDQPIVLIQVLYKDVFYIFGTDVYENYDNAVKYIRCSDEVDLLKKWVQVMRKFDVDIISGFHSQGYDIPMLYSRMNLIGLGDTFKKLSPFGYIDTTEEMVFGKMELRIDIKGVQHLDILDLVKKFDIQKYENNKLDTIAKAILGKGKIPYDGKLSDLMLTDFPKFLEYGKVDVQLLKEIEDVKNFIKMVVNVAYMDKCNYIDAFSQVRMWDNKIMTYLKHEYKVQVPYLIAKESNGFEESDDDKFEGAFVYEPKPDRYEWVISDDVQSMHPSIIMSFNISPETYLGNSKKNVEFFLKDCTQYTRELIDSNATTLANGAMFDRTYEGFLPKLIRNVFNMRIDAKTEAKKYSKLIQSLEVELNQSPDSLEIKYKIAECKNKFTNYDTIQNALKVKINSLFGFLGNKYSRFYQLDMAEGITLTSQVMLKVGVNAVSDTIKEITGTEDLILLYGDTDSGLFSFKSVVDRFVPVGTPKDKIVEFLDKFHKSKIEPRLSKKMTEIQNKMNAREHSIRFVRDVISDVSILLAKKRYIMSVYDKEGVRYSTPDLKIMGVDCVKTSTSQYCRNKIKEAIEKIVYTSNDEFIKFVADTKEEFMNSSVEDISTPRGINDIEKYTVDSLVVDSFGDDEDGESITYKSRTPIHVKASIFHNKLLMEKQLAKWVQPIENGDKIKFTYLKSPNPIGNNAIAFDGKLPEEFDLHKYVDYQMQYEKTFLNPVDKIAKVIGWTTEESAGMF
jgi:DNA polymerase elongation subunit (family B)